jgi:hypothetical protein
MNKFLISLIGSTALALAIPAYAGSDHDHGDDHGHAHETPAAETHDDHGHDNTAKEEHAHKDYGSVKEAWNVLNNTLTQAEAAVAGGDLKAVDSLSHELENVLHYLQDNAKAADGAKQKRLDGALKQLGKAANDLHEHSHAPAKETLEKTLKNLRGAMKLAEAQLPEGTL